jgi:prophage tail gpP-like protein
MSATLLDRASSAPGLKSAPPPQMAGPATSADVPSVTVDGKVYAGWTLLRVSRALDRCATDFDISVSERWSGQSEAWLIKPFSECIVSLGRDPVLTGYIDAYRPSFDRATHLVRIHGRSRTEDLIDCTPDIQSG